MCWYICFNISFALFLIFVRLDYGKKRGSTREEREKERLKHKYKKEFKGALREIRKDSRFLAREKLSEVMNRWGWRTHTHSVKPECFCEMLLLLKRLSTFFFLLVVCSRDAERKRKVKELFGSLATQEGEWKALKRRKRKWDTEAQSSSLLSVSCSLSNGHLTSSCGRQNVHLWNCEICGFKKKEKSFVATHILYCLRNICQWFTLSCQIFRCGWLMRWTDTVAGNVSQPSSEYFAFSFFPSPESITIKCSNTTKK